MGWGAALRLAVNKELAARAKNRAQNASLDEFYALKSIGGWRQGVSCLDWVTRKDGLALTVQWARRRDPAALGCVPAAFELPRDRVAWATAASAASSSWWIAKPANGSNSDGIRLLSAAAAAGEFASAPAPGTEGAAAVTVLQQYVPRPALIGGLKFDLRLYVLVLRRSRASAPVALLFWDGLARFATAPYACPAGVEGPTRARSQAAGAPAGRTETRGAAAPRSEDAAAPLLRAHLTNYVRRGAGRSPLQYHCPTAVIRPFLSITERPAVTPGAGRARRLGACRRCGGAPAVPGRGGRRRPQRVPGAPPSQHRLHRVGG